MGASTPYAPLDADMICSPQGPKGEPGSRGQDGDIIIADYDNRWVSIFSPEGKFKVRWGPARGARARGAL